MAREGKEVKPSIDILCTHETFILVKHIYGMEMCMLCVVTRREQALEALEGRSESEKVLKAWNEKMQISASTEEKFS